MAGLRVRRLPDRGKLSPMEPIEQELATLKLRQRQLAIKLQRLEDKQAAGDASPETATAIADGQYEFERTKFDIRDLESILAKGALPDERPTRRRVSEEERAQIEKKCRAEFRRRFGDDSLLHIYVGRIAAIDEPPEVRFFMAPPPASDGEDE
ncbi:MAG TPA: hypothetical protein VG942_15230 [Hyphomonadaceae bacterium]|nr:hypothetical protein [Hyphomonadaceae bacterium]